MDLNVSVKARPAIAGAFCGGLAITPDLFQFSSAARISDAALYPTESLKHTDVFVLATYPASIALDIGATATFVAIAGGVAPAWCRRPACGYPVGFTVSNATHYPIYRIYRQALRQYRELKNKLSRI